MVEGDVRITPQQQEIRVPEVNTVERFNELLSRWGRSWANVSKRLGAEKFATELDARMKLSATAPSRIPELEKRREEKRRANVLYLLVHIGHNYIVRHEK